MLMSLALTRRFYRRMFKLFNQRIDQILKVRHNGRRLNRLMAITSFLVNSFRFNPNLDKTLLQRYISILKQSESIVSELSL